MCGPTCRRKRVSLSRKMEKEQPGSHPKDQPFFMLAETYNYNAMNGKDFDFGDTLVNYFDHGFDSQINFGFEDASKSYEELFRLIPLCFA